MLSKYGTTIGIIVLHAFGISSLYKWRRMKKQNANYVILSSRRYELDNHLIERARSAMTQGH